MAAQLREGGPPSPRTARLKQRTSWPVNRVTCETGGRAAPSKCGSVSTSRHVLVGVPGRAPWTCFSVATWPVLLASSPGAPVSCGRCRTRVGTRRALPLPPDSNPGEAPSRPGRMGLSPPPGDLGDLGESLRPRLSPLTQQAGEDGVVTASWGPGGPGGLCPHLSPLTSLHDGTDFPRGSRGHPWQGGCCPPWRGARPACDRAPGGGRRRAVASHARQDCRSQTACRHSSSWREQRLRPLLLAKEGAPRERGCVRGPGAPSGAAPGLLLAARHLSQKDVVVH